MSQRASHFAQLILIKFVVLRTVGGYGAAGVVPDRNGIWETNRLKNAGKEDTPHPAFYCIVRRYFLFNLLQW